MYLPHSHLKSYQTFNDYTVEQSKTEGLGIMISILISREFGQTFRLKEKELVHVLKSK